MPYSYAWRLRRPADLAAACYACQRCMAEDAPAGLYSTLERAHLDGDSRNDDQANVAVLCRRCHRRLDHAQWIAAYRAWLESERARKIDARDAARPILAQLAQHRMTDAELAVLGAQDECKELALTKGANG